MIAEQTTLALSNTTCANSSNGRAWFEIAGKTMRTSSVMKGELGTGGDQLRQVGDHTPRLCRPKHERLAGVRLTRLSVREKRMALHSILLLYGG